MAIRFRKDRQRWQVYWKNPFTGKQESAFYASEKEAQKADSLKKHQLKYEKELFRPQEEDEQSKAVDDNLDAVIYSFLRAKNYQRNTMTAIIYIMRNILSFFGKDKAINDISADDMLAYREHIKKTGISMTTVKKRMSVLYAVIRWAQREKILSKLPDFPEHEKAVAQRFIPPTSDQLAKVLQFANTQAARGIIIGSKLGCRVGPCEMTKIRWDDFDFDRGVLRLRAAQKNLNEPMREIPIKSSLLNLFLQWYAEDSAKGIDVVFHFHGKPIKSFYRSLLKAQRLAGVTPFRPYDLRHTFASEALASGADVGTVSRLMGHTSPVMVLKTYQHVMTQQKKAAIEALPDILEVCPSEYARKDIVQPRKKKAR